MKTRKLRIRLFLLLIVTVLFSGCSNTKNTPIVTIDDQKLYMEDFLYDIYILETEGNQMEEYYQKNLGYSYWDYEYKGTTMRESAKSSVLTRVVMYSVLADQAQKNGVVLTEKEMEDNKQSLEQLYKTTPEATLNKVGLTREVLNKAYRKIALGDKYYLQLAKNFSINETAIRDRIKKEDYREYQTECLFVPTVNVSGQKITPKNQKEIDEAFQVITDTLEKVEAGSEFDTLLNEENRLSYHTRDFIYKDSIYEEAYQEASIDLKNGEHSGVISTNYGYYIIRMIDNNSDAEYENAVKDAIAAEEEEQFAVIYDKMKEPYDITIDFEYWDTITLGAVTVPTENE